MEIQFKSNTSTPAPEGAHPGRLVRIVDLGSQVTPFLHEDGTPVVSRKLSISWELYCDRMADGRPFMVSERYTRSLNEKSGLYKLLAQWLGKEWDDALKAGGFNFAGLLGRPCLVTVNHRQSKQGKTFAKLGAVTVLPKGLKPEDQVNPSLLFDLDKPAKLVLDQLPQWMQEEVGKSPEWKTFIGAAPATGDNTDYPVDIPF